MPQGKLTISSDGGGCLPSFDADGQVRHYAGGYDDWLLQRPSQEVEEERTASPARATPKAQPKKLSFKEKHQLEELPGQIEALEAEQATLTQRMMDPSFFGGGTSDAVVEVTARLAEISADLEGYYERWEALESLREALEG